MKNIKENLGIMCLIGAAIFALIITYFIAKDGLEQYNEQVATRKDQESKLISYEKQKKELDKKAEKEESELKRYKPFFEVSASETANNPGIYGTMFDDIIKLAQANGLMIRSIETDMNPSYDPVYTQNQDKYFACEFKFFFVGSYSQLQAYLSDMNNKFKYLMSISKLSVTSFEENPDYLLIKVSFTLYAQKAAAPAAQQGVFKTPQNR